MPSEIEQTIAARLTEADEAVSSAALAYSWARHHRAKIYAGAAEVLSQQQIADLTGVSQQRVSQVVQEATQQSRKVKKKPPKKVRRKPDA